MIFRRYKKKISGIRIIWIIYGLVFQCRIFGFWFWSYRLSLRSASRVPHHLDSDATFPESKSSQINNSSQTLSSVNEESISLAQRKGPLPPLPLHARAAMLKLNRSSSMQHFDSTIAAPLGVPPPPSYRAPTTPLSSAVSVLILLILYEIPKCM